MRWIHEDSAPRRGRGQVCLHTCVAMKPQASQLAPRDSAVSTLCRATSSHVPTTKPARYDSAAAVRRCRRHSNAPCCATSPTDDANASGLPASARLLSECTAVLVLHPAFSVLLCRSSCHSSLCRKQRPSKRRVEPPAVAGSADVGGVASGGTAAAGFPAALVPNVVGCVAASASVSRQAQFICATASGSAAAAGSRLSAAAAVPRGRPLVRSGVPPSCLRWVTPNAGCKSYHVLNWNVCCNAGLSTRHILSETAECRLELPDESHLLIQNDVARARRQRLTTAPNVLQSR